MKVKLLKVNTSVTKGPWQRWTQSSPSVLFSVFSGVWVWLCCMSAHKPPRSSCSFMWGRPLSRADLALQRAFSVPKPPSFICRSDRARPSLCTHLAFYLEAKQIWTLSLYPPPLRQSVSPPVSHSLARSRFANTSVTSTFLFPVSLYRSSVTRSLRPSPCIRHLPNKQTRTSDTSA